MKTGRFGTSETDPSRYAIGFADESEYILHCGDCFLIQKVDGGWMSVSIEMDNDWYLIDEQGNKHEIPWKSTMAKI